MERSTVIIGVVFLVVGALLLLMGIAWGNSWQDMMGYMMHPQSQGIASALSFFGVIVLIIGFLITIIGAVYPGKMEETPVTKNETPPPPQTKDDALDILKTRYAKGEITKKQYDQMKENLTK